MLLKSNRRTAPRSERGEGGPGAAEAVGPQAVGVDRALPSRRSSNPARRSATASVHPWLTQGTTVPRVSLRGTGISTGVHEHCCSHIARLHRRARTADGASTIPPRRSAWHVRAATGRSPGTWRWATGCAPPGRAHGLSLRVLADRLGISPSLISQVETGRAKPSVNTLYAMATELGVSIDELLFIDPRPARRAVAGTDRPAASLANSVTGACRPIPFSERTIGSGFASPRASSGND